MSSKADLQVNNTDLLEILGIAKKSEVAGTPYTGDNPLTIGKDGYTFPERTMLKEGLEVVNEVSDEGLFVWKKYDYDTETTTKGTFISYIVSSDEEAYPDGERDGYWYEKITEINEFVNFFKTKGWKVAVDKFSFTTNSDFRNRQIPHSLGVVPLIVLLFADNPKEFPNKSNSYVISVSGTGTHCYDINGEIKLNWSWGVSASTDKYITCDQIESGQLYFPAGVGYTLITSAMI